MASFDECGDTTSMVVKRSEVLKGLHQVAVAEAQRILNRLEREYPGYGSMYDTYAGWGIRDNSQMPVDVIIQVLKEAGWIAYEGITKRGERRLVITAEQKKLTQFLEKNFARVEKKLDDLLPGRFNPDTGLLISFAELDISDQYQALIVRIRDVYGTKGGFQVEFTKQPGTQDLTGFLFK